jgi:hypothetical protein
MYVNTMNEIGDSYLPCIAMAHSPQVTVVDTAALYYGCPLHDKTPYHTSALTKANWVHKLLNGHPEHIHNELGVHKEVFNDLITALQEGRLRSFKHVVLEEQLAIFLYTFVMGLSLHHVCE